MAVEDFFKRVIINPRERPNSGDLNRLQDRTQESIRLLANAVHGEANGSVPLLNPATRTFAQAPNGFASASFQVSPDPGAAPYGLLITPGFGFAPTGPASATDYSGANGLNWDSGNWAPLVLSAFQQGISVPSVPSAGHSRIDIIEVRANYRANDPATVGVFNPATEVFDPTVLAKSFSWDLLGLTGSVNAPNPSTAAISYKVGVDHTGGISGATEPAVTPGYMKIARINLDGAVASITSSLIADLRRPIWPNAMAQVSGLAAIPGTAAGLGSESLASIELPPGVVVKMGYYNNTPPAAGESYSVDFFIIGAGLVPRTATRFSASVTSASTNPVCPVVTSTVYLTVDAALQGLLAGSDPNYTVVNGTYTFPLGTKVALLSVKVLEPTGAALSSTQDIFFHANLCLA